MAIELVVAGPGKPVVHKPIHDLESLFYVLVGICVLLDEPHKMKKDLSCFDTYFNSFHPSSDKTSIIQSNVGWRYKILPHISPYFEPLIPLLKKLRDKIIVPIDIVGSPATPPEDPVTHDFIFKALLEALWNLEDKSWIKVPPPSNDDETQLPPISGSLPLAGTEPASSVFQEEQLIPSRIPRPALIRPISGSGFPAARSSAGSLGSNRTRRISTEPDSDRHTAKRPRPSPSSTLHLS